jgi:small-conductance mechanosensitive channel
MQKAVESLLRQHLGEHLQHVTVQFSEAADSSLNFAVWVDCDGAAAAQWEQVSLWTQQALVEVCNQEGWTIPFPQLQVHTS